MLLSLFYWIYLSLVCFTWGIITCRFFTRGEAIESLTFPHVSMLCLLGLTATGTLSMYVSLYVPLSWTVHIAIAIPAVVCWCFTSVRKQMWRLIFLSMPSGWINSMLLVVLLLMILSITSSNIIHPDTLSYHLQSIRWFEQFKVVPGIVNVDTELGMQSLWFAANALFRPEFSNEHFAIFLNGAVLSWFVLYICSNLTARSLSFCLIGLLIFTLVSWTQVRLTAASASPDFIVVLYILAAAVLYLNGEKDDRLSQMMVIAFACTAIAIKMSALLFILLPVMMIISYVMKRQFRAAFRVLLLCVVLLTPVLVRNSIATGYPLFPSSLLQLDVEWKYPEENMETFRNYIRDYARSPSESETDPSDGWVYGWWQQLTIVDQVLIIGVLLSILALFLRIRRIIAIISLRELIVLLIAVLGAVVWWVMAPDPRFGSAYLLLIIILAAGILSRLYNPAILKMKSLLNAAIILISFVVAGYTVYRFCRYNNTPEILIPSGVTNTDFATTTCSTVPVNFPVTDTLCGSIPAPCIPDTCRSVIPLGTEIEGGFKKKINGR